jgi:hypothetical protein
MGSEGKSDYQQLKELVANLPPGLSGRVGPTRTGEVRTERLAFDECEMLRKSIPIIASRRQLLVDLSTHCPGQRMLVTFRSGITTSPASLRESVEELQGALADLAKVAATLEEQDRQRIEAILDSQET